MAVLFVLLSVLAAMAGLLFLSEATTGVGIIGLACYFGILARIGQADAQHKKLMAAIEESQPAREGATPAAAD